MQIHEAAELVKILSEAYPRDEWSPDRIRLWTLLLADLDQQAARESVLQWIRSEKWTPTVAEIRDLAGALAKQPVTALQLCPPWEHRPDPTPEQRALGARRAEQLVKECAARIGKPAPAKKRESYVNSPEQAAALEAEKARQLAIIRASLESESA